MGVTRKLLTGIQNGSSSPTTRSPDRIGVEPDLLGRLANGGRREIGVTRLGGAARERDLAGVMPVVARPLDQHDGAPRRRRPAR